MTAADLYRVYYWTWCECTHIPRLPPSYALRKVLLFLLWNSSFRKSIWSTDEATSVRRIRFTTPRHAALPAFISMLFTVTAASFHTWTWEAQNAERPRRWGPSRGAWGTSSSTGTSTTPPAAASPSASPSSTARTPTPRGTPTGTRLWRYISQELSTRRWWSRTPFPPQTSWAALEASWGCFWERLSSPSFRLGSWPSTKQGGCSTGSCARFYVAK